MIQKMRSISSKPEWNGKEWWIYLGMNYFRQYVITKNVYLNQEMIIPRIRKEKDLKIYYIDGFLKNSNQFVHAKRIASQYQTNIYYLDALRFLALDLLSDPNEDRMSPLIDSIKRDNSIFICSFDAAQILNKYLFIQGRQLENVDLLALSPYFDNFTGIDRIMSRQFVYNFKKTLIDVYSEANNSPEIDTTVQKYMNIHDLPHLIGELALHAKQNEQQQVVQPLNKICFRSLNILLASQDRVLFENSKGNSGSDTLNHHLDSIYSLYDSTGHKTQYIIDSFSPAMQFIYKNPYSIALELMLKDIFTMKES